MLLNESLGLNVWILSGYTPKIVPSIKWTPLSNGKFCASDRGVECDAYSTEIVFAGTYAEMTSVLDELDLNPGRLTIECLPGEPVFGPHFKPNQPLECIIVQSALERVATDYFRVSVQLELDRSRTLSLYSHTSITDLFIEDDVTEPDFFQETLFSFKSVEPAIVADRLEKYSAISSYRSTGTIVKKGAYDSVCKLKLKHFESDSSNKMGKLLKCFLTITRANPFLYPGNLGAWGGIADPFGPRSSINNGLHVCKVSRLELGARENARIWPLYLELQEI